MTSNAHDPPRPASSELQGLGILLVEDSWHVGKAIKFLLRILGADVAGPAATTAEADRLVAERTPDVAIVDINLSVLLLTSFPSATKPPPNSSEN